MSPEATCPRCGRIQVFHEKEMKNARVKKKVVCLECGLEREYHVFLAEVLDGQHPELIEQLREEMMEEREWE
jgi:transcription elongation factor Elf1